MNKLKVKNRAEWRSWLTTNHNQVSEVWLVYPKGKTAEESIDYEASIEEALCFGWVDSLIKRIDEVSYARKFTPRKSDSKWSPLNQKRVKKLTADGSMTEHGLRVIEAARKNGQWDNPVSKPDMNFGMTEEFSSALQENEKARTTYERLAPSHQKQYLAWIGTAKLPETRTRRITESIRMLSEGKKLGLK